MFCFEVKANFRKQILLVHFVKSFVISCKCCIVEYLPTPPKFVTVKPLNGTTMVVYWASPDENCDQASMCHYLVFLNKTTQERQQVPLKQ